MRKEINELNQLKMKSILIPGEHEFENKMGEVFQYENGELIFYCDTRVISKDTEGLVNLFNEPLQFDFDQVTL